ncbi:hypothetical protein [Lacticaseibacillus saniviri]|uniref:Uncharacterized protein n=1 Tax=Lacticaseibacillus saniviri JCM 17471 = DSM 24301 TaxID=1293598 RepID=A0A0R2MN75_9LACO|nr:hypothetical protein [Lacticaseibacillus saniviri]KRO15140.1 hypothetical protein IV56_GL000229 [Lacticaseibacillus saniviri JCM 17471 = DSM 24301]MCG4281918.1 hypothetical protein [Lacticaseibacillus saniviri]
MQDYSNLSKVYKTETANALRETISTYQNGNYRSTINSLYSAVILDLVSKLQELAEVYQDGSAKEILEKASKTQKSSPYDPGWEKSLLDEIKTMTELMSSKLLIAGIETLKNLRNISSHPSMLESRAVLYTPNKYEVAGLIGTMMTELFQLPPRITGNVIDKLTDDLSGYKKEFLMKPATLKSFLRDNYFHRLNKTQLEFLGKNLFKFIFVNRDKESKENREINYRALDELMKECPDAYVQISQSRDLVSRLDLKDEGNDIGLRLIEEFCQEHPGFWTMIPRVFQEQIINHVSSNICRWLLNGYVDSEDSISRLHTALNLINKPTQGSGKSESEKWFPINVTRDFYQISDSDMKQVWETFELEGETLNIVKLFAALVSRSDSYDTSEHFVNNLIPYLQYFDYEMFKALFAALNSNSQAYDARTVQSKVISIIYPAFAEKFSKDTDEAKSLLENFKVY